MILISKNLWALSKWTKRIIGGKDKNRHWDKKTHIKGGEMSGKTTVIGAISRKGNVVCQIIESTDTPTLDRFVRQRSLATRFDLIATDEHSRLSAAWRTVQARSSVDHGQASNVRGEVHTNNIESFWSLLKRGVMGTYHHVSKKYLPLYLAEFQFRYNNRNNPDIFGSAVSRMLKRPNWRMLLHHASRRPVQLNLQFPRGRRYV